MVDILILLFLASLLCLIIGLISPEFFTLFFGDNSTRRTIILIFGSTTFVLFFLNSGLAYTGTVDKTQLEIEPATQKAETESYKETQIIYFETEKKEDPFLPEGESKIKRPGKAGEKVVKYEAKMRAGEEISRKVIDEKVTREHINKIIAVGTQKIETSLPEIVPFTTQINTYPYRGPEFSHTRREGVNGEKVREYQVGYIEGKEVTRTLVREVFTRAPVQKIVAIGTKK